MRTWQGCSVVGRKRIIATRTDSDARRSNGPVTFASCSSCRADLRLLEALQAEGCLIENGGPAEVLGRLPPCSTVLLVLRLRGDNDLQASDLQGLSALARNRLHDKRIVVVFKGDRHALDCKVQSNYPAVVKTRRLLQHAAELVVCEHKLDPETLNWVARFSSRHLCSRPPRELVLVAKLRRILDGEPAWDPKRRILDLFNQDTGYGLLYGRRSATIRAAAAAIASIQPAVLVARGSGLRDELMNPLWRSQTSKVDLSSNRMSLSAASQVFPKASYLNLGANQMRLASLQHCSTSLKHLYLHKNHLAQVDMTSVGGAKLETLSLYRNEISEVDIGHQGALAEVNLGANPLIRVPPSLESATRLRSLGLARTRVTTLPDWLVESSTLQRLDISYIEDALPASQLKKLEGRGVEIVKKPASPQ